MGEPTTNVLANTKEEAVASLSNALWVPNRVYVLELSDIEYTAQSSWTYLPASNLWYSGLQDVSQDTTVQLLLEGVQCYRDLFHRNSSSKELPPKDPALKRASCWERLE